MTQLNNFTGLFPLSKTLRFEAVPMLSTYDNIHYLLEQDNSRAKSSQKVKELIDEYHKQYIIDILSSFRFEDDELKRYYELYTSKVSDSAKTVEFKKLKEKMRKGIHDSLTRTDKYKRIFKKELIEQDLPDFINEASPEKLCGMTQDDAFKIVRAFKGFTTNLTSFNQNRANMYSADEKSTGIPNRVVNENLPRFLDNILVFQKLIKVPEINDSLNQLSRDFSDYLGTRQLDQIFDVNNYNDTLTQTEIDQYNGLIEGRTEGNAKKKIQGLNEYINLYNQNHKKDKLPKFKILYKQILSDRISLSWLPDKFESDQELLDAIQNCYEDLQGTVLGSQGLQKLLTSIDSYNSAEILIKNDAHLSDISQRHYHNWNLIQEAIKEDLVVRENIKKKKSESEEDYQKRITNIFKRKECFSLAYIDECVKKANDSIACSIAEYFKNLDSSTSDTESKNDIFTRISEAYARISDLLTNPYPKDKKLCQDDLHREQIKDLLDALKRLQRFIKPLADASCDSGKDVSFYGELLPLWSKLNAVSILYDMVRNRIICKPYEIQKFKLNLDNSQLFRGWDENKLCDYGCLILRRDHLFYIAIMDKSSRKLLKTEMPITGECYERMVYKNFKDITTMVPKCTTQLKNVVEHFSESADDYVLSGPQFIKSLVISKEIFDLNNTTYSGKKKFQVDYERTTGDTVGYKDAVRKWIDFCRLFLSSYKSTSCYDLSGLKSNYDSINEFYKDVNELLYKVSFTPVSVNYIHKLVEEGKMYLFQLYNKDFSEYSKGIPNLHTLYWRALFEENNLESPIYKLNGQAELFFRPGSIKPTGPTHRANEPVANKNPNNFKLESLFTYDLVKDKRYTTDKFMFHVPITINFRNKGVNNLNGDVREYLKENDSPYIIGIDRGERHLIYLVVIDGRGNIVEQYSLNKICNEYKGNKYETDYHGLLSKREDQQRAARVSWQTIESIKELKDGYLSQVVHKIVQLIVKYHAIVVLEDLNGDFIRRRQKVEKQVYQKFEKSLIDKLNYLVDKQMDPDKPGGIRNAFQLTNKFDSFNNLGKQSGFLFYVPAWNTSMIDPRTGFVNLFDTSYKNVEDSINFFKKFDSIVFNPDRDTFEFTFDYCNFYKEKAEGTRTKWTISSHDKRIIKYKNPDKNNQWDSKDVTLTEEFKSLFEKHGIDIKGKLKEQIVSQSDKTFFEALLNCLKWTLQMRNSRIGTDEDYLVSPVIDEKGEYFDSRTSDNSLPQNADANGAFNIARKGLMIVEQIKRNGDKIELTNKSWLKFAQGIKDE